MSFLLREPPTKESIRDARNALHLTRREISQLTTQIDTADAALALLVHDSKKNINSLIAHRAHLEATELRTLAYLSPIRKLPSELLRDIFISNFDEYPCCAWVLAAVCSSWRRLVLQTPKLWSKVFVLFFLRHYDSSHPTLDPPRHHPAVLRGHHPSLARTLRILGSP
jgi:hypothetical protein